MAANKMVVALLLSAVACSVGAAQVYKWVDAQGRMHYSDTPKPGWKRVDLNVAPGFAPVTIDGASASGGADPTDTRAQLRAEECQRRRDQLESYRKAATVVSRDALGNEKAYSEEERLQLIEQTQRQVVELCGSSALE